MDLYRFRWVKEGRSYEGVFLATSEELDGIFGKSLTLKDADKEIYGKPIDVVDDIDQGDILLLLKEGQGTQEIFDRVGSKTVSGYNPVVILEESSKDGTTKN